MSIIKKILILLIFSTSFANAENLKKIGKFKDWEAILLIKDAEKICFAQSKPVLQSPKGLTREARLFVTFRPNNKITDEISATSGYEYNSQNSIRAKSGKNKYKFDIAKDVEKINNMNIFFIKDMGLSVLNEHHLFLLLLLYLALHLHFLYLFSTVP